MRHRLIVAAACASVMVLAGLAPATSPAAEVAPAPTVAVQPAKAANPDLPRPAAASAVNRPQTIDPKKYHKFTGPNISQRVVLTYDDCPKDLKSLNAVLVYVRGANIGLVLAPTGECVAIFKKKYGIDLAAHMRLYGQYVINHSRSHPDLTTLSPASIRRQLSGEVKTDYGRPPYGARNKDVDAVYAAVGMRQWLWDVDTRDWEKGGKSEAQIVKYVVTHTTPGSTVLMHMQHAGFSPEAIGDMATGLRTRPEKVLLCRAFRGWNNPPDGPVLPAPVRLGNNVLPC